MSEIHDFIREHGTQLALKLSLGEEHGHIVTAGRLLEEHSNALGITYSGFAMTSLPHKRLADDAVWERKSGKFSMMIEPGHLRVNRQTKQFGVPYGSRARLILLYMQTQAIRNDCRKIQLGRSLGTWIERMGLPHGGKTYELVKEQARRISACTMTVYYEGDKGSGFQRDTIIAAGERVRKVRLADVAKYDEDDAWEESVWLSQVFFGELKKHPVPVLEAAVRAIANKSLAIDIYIWLAYRLRALADPMPISWDALYDQFGGGFRRSKHFKEPFLEALRWALDVYPDGRVHKDGPNGLILLPSPSPVGDRVVLKMGNAVTNSRENVDSTDRRR